MTLDFIVLDLLERKRITKRRDHRCTLFLEAIESTYFNNNMFHFGHAAHLAMEGS